MFLRLLEVLSEVDVKLPIVRVQVFHGLWVQLILQVVERVQLAFGLGVDAVAGSLSDDLIQHLTVEVVDPDAFVVQFLADCSVDLVVQQTMCFRSIASDLAQEKIAL